MRRVIAILNQKGGVGKTTTTTNLAAYLAKAGRKVLIVDLDPQGNTSSGLGLDKQTLNSTLYDVLFGRAELDKTIRRATTHNLDLLPSNAQLAAAEVELVGLVGRELKLRQMLESLDHYDYILIDCPPSLGLLSINALTAADEVLIPVQTEYYAMEGLTQLLDVIQQVRQALNPNLNLLGVILTMYDSRTSLSEQVQEEVKRHFGGKVFTTVIPRNIRLAEAPSFGRTIHEHDPLSRGALAYQELAKELESKLL